MKFIKSLFTRASKRNQGFSEFFRRASIDEQKKVVTEAAKRANKDQRKVLEQVNSQA